MNVKISNSFFVLEVSSHGHLGVTRGRHAGLQLNMAISISVVVLSTFVV